MSAIGGMGGVGAMGPNLGAVGGGAATGTAGALAGGGSAGAAGVASPAGSEGASGSVTPAKVYMQVDRILNEIDPGLASNQFLRLALALLLLDALSDRDREQEARDMGLVGLLALGGARANNQITIVTATDQVQSQNGAAAAYTQQAVHGAASASQPGMNLIG